MQKIFSGKITVLLADDHGVVREGLRSLLTAEQDIEIVAEADNGREAIKLTRELRPSVVVMDLAMPLLNGVEATRQIMQQVRKSKVLVLTSYGDDSSVTQAMKAGAAGFLMKQTAAAELVRAIRELHNGNAYFSPSIAKRLREHCRAAVNGDVERAAEAKPSLTAREAEVLQLVAEGFPNKGIASELSISIKTVEKHRQQVMNKLGIHDVAGLTRYAIAQGIVERDAAPKGAIEHVAA
jgi:DNA-binding NarL/FixJ family response regulator